MRRLEPGTLIDGRYRLDEPIGRGGMATVWAAVDCATSRKVALKVLNPSRASHIDAVARLEREGRLARRIRSPYVCRLLGSGRAVEGAYLVYERLRGESLDARLEREQSLSFGELGAILDEVLAGLCAAHAAGVVHRDLKPANVFLRVGRDRSERAKLLDFGVAVLRGQGEHDEREPTLTSAETTVGTFAYMAPEQIGAAALVDERADVYAAATIAFRALAGRLPFVAPTPAALVAMKRDRDPPSLTDVTGERWPGAIERFLRAGLTRHPSARFGSALEAREAWHDVRDVVEVGRAPGADAAASSRRRAPSEDGFEPRERTQTLTLDARSARPLHRRR